MQDREDVIFCVKCGREYKIPIVPVKNGDGLENKNIVRIPHALCGDGFLLRDLTGIIFCSHCYMELSIAKTISKRGDKEIIIHNWHRPCCVDNEDQSWRGMEKSRMT